MIRIGQREPTLADHARRPVRAFLRDPKVVDGPLEAALWDVIYTGTPAVDHALALQVAREVEATATRVEDVVHGWRPKSLRAPASDSPASEARDPSPM